jgi:hypothetical protein
MAISKSGCLKILAIPVGGLIILVAINWKTTMLMLAILLSAFSYHPPITKDLHAWGKAEFTARLNRQFPVGTPEAKLASTLRKQRFTVNGREASFHGEWLPCNINYEVRWTADISGRLTSVEGDHIEAGCL